MLVLHYQVYGEDRFPKLFSYKKLFVRFTKYQNAKQAHCTKSESRPTTVPGGWNFVFMVYTHSNKSMLKPIKLGFVQLQNITQAETDIENRAKQIIVVFSIIIYNLYHVT